MHAISAESLSYQEVLGSEVSSIKHISSFLSVQYWVGRRHIETRKKVNNVCVFNFSSQYCVLELYLVFLCPRAFVFASQCVLHVSSAQLGAGNLETGMGHISLSSYKSSAQDNTSPPTKIIKI